MIHCTEITLSGIDSLTDEFQITVNDGYVSPDGRVTPGTLTAESNVTPNEHSAKVHGSLRNAKVKVHADAPPLLDSKVDGSKLVVNVGALEKEAEAWEKAASEGTARALITIFLDEENVEVEMFFHQTPRIPTKVDPLVDELRAAEEGLEETFRRRVGEKLPIRLWQGSGPTKSLSSQIQDDNSFVVYTWNILALGLSSGPPGIPELAYQPSASMHEGETETPFRHSCLARDSRNDYGGFVVPNPELFEWDVRKTAIVAEIMRTHPSILCLQEVDRYHDWFKPIFDEVGYDSLFCPKLESPTLTRGWYSDGVAIFWKKNEFVLEDSEAATQISRNPVVMVTLKDIKKGRRLLVATTHLKASEGPEAEGRRFNQVKELLQRVTKKRESTKCHVVICGDFNTDAFNYEKQNALVVPHVIDDGFTSAYPLPTSKDVLSADGGVEDKPAEYFATTVKERQGSFKAGVAKRSIDYIFYGENDFNVIQRLFAPLANAIESTHLPNKYPSDHYALAARLQWK